MPFTEEQAEYFFGREEERKIIAANLMASRLTLLYGPSGVGKSSVLNAGVAHDLRAEAADSRLRRGTADFAWSCSATGATTLSAAWISPSLGRSAAPSKARRSSTACAQPPRGSTAI